ncbi:flagellar biosynthesis anti-sigma factor FlgM [Oribacterium sp. WCC10]|uniref:flagellar biosynthesis anti-sigma factor FlgM n=1 Tax=Oribacterium sp. WCC10 TaxID=1855343 RepID=UPI0008E11D89|nr:flagellar biosynthesis anti-sigma factor FlgM [Oribacterium sp. WCC10]SFG24515.1 flagellar biosynthesis anti-sigma factor FlgM [Oribacterium sp. WCC10]
MDVNLRTTLIGNVGYSNSEKKVNKKDRSSSASSASYVRSYDKASFSAADSVSNESFASMLASRTAASMRTGVSDARVAELKAQVQSGTYNVDSTRIAARMLGYRG